MTRGQLLPAREAHHRLQALGPFIAVFSLLAVLWGLVLVFAVIQERRFADQGQRQLRLINNAVLQQTRGLLQAAESGLEVLDHWVQSHPQNDLLPDTGRAELIEHLDRGSGGLVSFGFASEAGLALAAPGAAPWQVGMPAITWPTRTGEVRVGVPLRSASGAAWRWPVSRRLNRASGEIAGVVAWVDLARLSALQESLREKPAGAISLMTADGRMVLRTPPIDGLIGRDLSDRKPRTVQATASGTQGTFTDDGALTGGQPRLVSFEHVDRYPVTVLVSQDVDEVMAAFRNRRNLGVLVLALITVAAFGFSVLLARSQRATRRSQAELSALDAAFPLGLFRTDTSGKTTYANEAYFQKLGLLRERMAWGWSEIIEPAQRDEVRQTWQRAAALGRPATSVLNIQRPDGKEAALSVHTAPLHVDGKLVGQVGSLEDITERIQQQKAQRMLTAIFEKSTDVVAQVDTQGRLLYLNPAGRALLAMGPEDPVHALHYDDFMPAHRETQVRDEILPTAVARGVWVGETSVLASGGREIDVSEMLIAHRDEAQHVETFSVVMRDITQDLRARVELQRSESILNIVAATLPALVAVIDDQERYLFTNDAYDRWAGWPHNSAVGLNVKEVIGEAEYARSQGHIGTALAGRRVMFESERDSAECFETTYIPFRGVDGRVVGLVALSQDITLHKLQQQKLLDASQTDPLTGTLNRAGFDLRIREALARARHDQHPLALLCIDLDSFKTINDEHGHGAGDALLAAAARRLQHDLRPADVLARLGGDEFAVVLPDVKDERAARTVASKIVNALGTPFEIDGRSLKIGGSVGVALTLQGQDSVQSLMQRADAALYQAKRAGRGRFEVAAEVA